MNPNESTLNRSELLRLDELGDQLEAAARTDPDFDADAFFSNIEEPALVSMLREELERIRSNQARESTSNSQPTWVGSGKLHAVDSFRAGMFIDNFELTKMVGRGATAVVWQARNTALDRPVALKFPTVYSSNFANRLQRESQAVARLQHPHIATIYEIRRHGQGAYLVSEFVAGRSLQETIELRGAPNDKRAIRQALEMLLSITEAIAYSHSMRVIHRDLKPHNILVRKDNSPVVVDFGLARMLQKELEVLTNEGDLLGTPAYMAPEQAQGRSDLDERVDIYSLGVLMFQLLTGELPFSGNIQSLVHQIVYVQPPRPSRLNGKISLDLETICLKCLEKDPANRFQSAQQLALELTRFLNDEPVQSRPPSTREKLVRWARQKPTEASLSGLLVLSVLTLVCGAMTYAFTMQKMHEQERAMRVDAQQAESHAKHLTAQVEKALEQANAQQRIARREALEHKSTVDFLKGVFQNSEPVTWVLKADGASTGKPPTLRELFDNAARRLENEYTGRPAIQANLLETLGDSCRSATFFDIARRLLLRAREYRVEQFAQLQANTTHDRSADPASLLLGNSILLARLDHDLGDFDAAAARYRECLAHLKQRNDNGSEDLELEAETLFHFGRLLLTQRDNFEAQRCFRRAIDCYSKIGKSDTFLARAAHAFLEFANLAPGEIPSIGTMDEFFQQDSWGRRTIEELADILLNRGLENWPQTAQHYQNLLEILRERVPEDNQWYLLALGDYAEVQRLAGRYDEAFRAIRIAIEHGDRIAPQHPHLLDAKHRLGQELHRAGRHEEALIYLAAAERANRTEQLTFEDINVDLWFDLADCHLRLHRPQRALQICSELEAGVNRWSAVETAWLRYLQGNARIMAGDPAGRNQLEEAIELARRLRQAPRNGIWCHRLAEICLAGGENSLAVGFARASVQFDADRFFANHPRVANRRMQFGKALQQAGAIAAAREQFGQALASRTEFLDPGNPLIDTARHALQSAERNFTEIP